MSNNPQNNSGNRPANYTPSRGQEQANNGYKPPTNRARPAPPAKPPASSNKNG